MKGLASWSTSTSSATTTWPSPRRCPTRKVFYAVKANPAPEILKLLAELGSCFDVASVSETEMVLAAGATPDRISYGNTDQEGERDRRAPSSSASRCSRSTARPRSRRSRAPRPAARVICRIHCDGTGSEWPLSRKFGCEPDYAADILELAHRRGPGAARRLVPCRLAAAQCRGLGPRARLDRGDLPRLRRARHQARRWSISAAASRPNTCARRRSSKAYGKAIFRALRKHFGNAIPETIIEPGRGLVGNAGMIEAEVVLIAKRSPEDEVRWVYLDIGKFHGLAETIDESIRYPIRTPQDRDEMAPCVIAGPTCDSVDVLYEKNPYPLPISLAIGDKVLIEATGAYTTTYSSVGFNGYPPLRQYVI